MNQWSDQTDVLEFPDGRRVRGTGLHRSHGPVEPPEFAVYLLARAPGDRDWEFRWVQWRDFGLPASMPMAVDAVREAFERSAEERVVIACAGGLGRTGTALALMSVMAGIPVDDAVDWVRTHYDRRAVETRGQRRWVREAAALL